MRAWSPTDLSDGLRARAERHVYLTVRAPSGSEGFALFGGHRPRHFFSRAYLGTREHSWRLRVGRATGSSCRGLLEEFGLVVFCGDSAPPDLEGHTLRIPAMVGLVAQTPAVLDGPEAPWGGSTRENIRRVKRAGFQWDVQTGDTGLVEFERRFHVPSMAQRHEVDALLVSARQMRAMIRSEQAELIRVLRDGEWVAGCFARSTPDAYRPWCMGWRDGDPQLFNANVVSAIYWFFFQRAAQLGHSKVALSVVAPYLEGGLLFFKANWGGRLEPVSSTYGRYDLLLDPSNAACRRFLAGHSLLARGADGATIVYSAKRPGEVNVPSGIMDGVSRWYRWREQPDTTAASGHTDVPRALRPWLAAEPIPRAQMGEARTCGR